MPDLWPPEDDPPEEEDDIDELFLSADEAAEFFRQALHEGSSDEDGDGEASADEASAQKRLQKSGAPASATTIKKYSAYWLQYTV